MQELKLTIPTYNARLFFKDVEANRRPEYGEPLSPVLVRGCEGIRVVLATHSFDDLDKPELQIERHSFGWMIILHPQGGGDPSGYVYFLDDGRSFVQSENGMGSTRKLFVLSAEEIVPGFDPPD